MHRRLAALFIVAAALIAPAGAHAAGRCGDHPWCDAAKSPDERAALVLAELTLPEKLDLLWGDEQQGVLNVGGGAFHTGRNNGVLRLGIPDLFFSDGPVGPRQGEASTAMPAPIGLAASFDPALARVAGGLIADEVKAKGNDVVYAPTVNIMRHAARRADVRGLRGGPVPGRPHRGRLDPWRPGARRDRRRQALRGQQPGV
jgi:beta-glucosidase